MVRARPSAIDVFDPQQEAPAALDGEIVRADRGKGMAEVEPPGRARREAGDDGLNHGVDPRPRPVLS